MKNAMAGGVILSAVLLALAVAGAWQRVAATQPRRALARQDWNGLDKRRGAPLADAVPGVPRVELPQREGIR
jgi:hypothetical protein